jgi:biopolymer transport protein ExbD
MINSRRGVLKKMATHVGPNMTPMVDVVMCILIFFMLGTSLAMPELLLKSNTAAIDKEALGAQGAALKLPAVPLRITLTRGDGGTLVQAFGETPMAMSKIGDADQKLNEALYAKLAARRKTISDEIQVLIVPSKEVPWQDVVTIYDQCVKLQFKQVAFYPVK